METTYEMLEVANEDLEVIITWEPETCECTSEYGNSTVTERWTEHSIKLIESDGQVWELGDATNDEFSKACEEAVEGQYFQFDS